MRILVTGATGFVGKYMVDYLESLGIEVIGTGRSKMDICKNYTSLDLLDQTSVVQVIKNIMPTHVIHLAGQSSVSESWINKQSTINVNINCTLNLLDALRQITPDCKVLTVGSSEEYGLINPVEIPVNEMNTFKPMSPYGVSKLAVGLLSMQYAKAYKMNIIHSRTFNHIGPGQSLGFVTQDFANQIVKIENNELHPVIKVGNLEAVRDFTDVRDIVKAYYNLLVRTEHNDIYNVCSGIGIKISTILKMLLEMSPANINIEIDSSKLRPSEVPILIGDNTKLINAINWNPDIPIQVSLLDILNHYRIKK